jgi:hypothetical protein
MKAESSTSIKNDIVIIAKESAKFALVAMILFFLVGPPLLYLFIRLSDMDTEMAAFLTGAIIAILIVVVDQKKIHTNDKIAECNRRIIRKVLKLT